MNDLFVAERHLEIVSTPLGDAVSHLNWDIEWRLQKWDHDELDRLGLLACVADELEAEGVKPYEDLVVCQRNLLLNNGINRLCNLLIGTPSIGNYANGTARVGVGNGTTAVAATDTDLSAVAGSANRWFQICDATFPSVATQVVTAKATFATGDGNFAWNEWGIDGGGGTSGNTVGTNGASTCALLNRVKPGTSLGTKTSGSWALTATITIS